MLLMPTPYCPSFCRKYPDHTLYKNAMSVYAIKTIYDLNETVLFT